MLFSRTTKPKEELKDLAYQMAETLNQFDLTVNDARYLSEYFYKCIMPFQVDKSLRANEADKFRVVIPQTVG